jgi:hypothetical protein
MEITLGNQVKIACRNSAYDGVTGIVFEIQAVSRYAIVVMPEGTERRLEGIQQNRIRSQRQASQRPNPIPPGDPQWFPMKWLRPLPAD